MNCKPGDLAVIVHSRSGRSIGRIVEVLSPAAPGDMASGYRYAPQESGPFWRIKGRLTMQLVSGDFVDVDEWFTLDAYLRPIRDQDGEDETLTWAGKPSDIKTPERA